MRFYISADIEGVAGVVSRQQTSEQGFEYGRACAWMTGEVRAVVEAVRARGASECVISDSHGNGQNLLLDELPSDIRLVRSWPRPLGMMQGIEQGRYAGAALIGYHAASTNVQGTLSHSFSTAGIVALHVNGAPASEALVSAAVAGHYGVPILLVSGDDIFVEEARAMLGHVEAVVTKHSTGWQSALTITHEAACAELRRAGEAAWAGAGRVKPFELSTPIEVELVLHDRLAAETLSFLKFIERTGALSVRYAAVDAIDMARFLSFLLFFKLNSR
jgi:D-amino peptidase